MNNLSWLLYFAEVSENVGSALSIITVLSAIVAVSFWCIHILIPQREQSENFFTLAPKYAKTAATIFTLSLLGLLFPSQNTVYLIIASESAEMVVTSESGQKMIGDIQQIVSLKLETIAQDIVRPTQSNNGNR